jgi:hypothetical protein
MAGTETTTMASAKQKRINFLIMFLLVETWLNERASLTSLIKSQFCPKRLSQSLSVLKLLTMAL